MYFAKYGANVVLSARSVEKLEDVKKRCIEEAKKNGFDIKVQVLPLDILKFDSHKECALQVIANVSYHDKGCQGDGEN